MTFFVKNIDPPTTSNTAQGPRTHLVELVYFRINIEKLMMSLYHCCYLGLFGDTPLEFGFDPIKSLIVNFLPNGIVYCLLRALVAFLAFLTFVVNYLSYSSGSGRTGSCVERIDDIESFRVIVFWVAYVPGSYASFEN